MIPVDKKVIPIVHKKLFIKKYQEVYPKIKELPDSTKSILKESLRLFRSSQYKEASEKISLIKE